MFGHCFTYKDADRHPSMATKAFHRTETTNLQCHAHTSRTQPNLQSTRQSTRDSLSVVFVAEKCTAQASLDAAG